MSVEKFKEILEQCKAVAKLLGATEEQAIKTAIERAKNELGADYSGILNIDINDHETKVAIDQDDEPGKAAVFLKVSELSEMLNLPRTTPNIILFDMGYIARMQKSGCWPTKKAICGKDYIRARNIKWNLEFFKRIYKEYNEEFNCHEYLNLGEIRVFIKNVAYVPPAIISFILFMKGYTRPSVKSETNHGVKWQPSKKAKIGIEYRRVGEGQNIRWNKAFIKKICQDFLNKFNQDE
jgi:hypothetical protein